MRASSELHIRPEAQHAAAHDARDAMIRGAERRQTALRRVGVGDVEQLHRRLECYAPRQPDKTFHGEIADVDGRQAIGAALGDVDRLRYLRKRNGVGPDHYLVLFGETGEVLEVAAERKPPGELIRARQL